MLRFLNRKSLQCPFYFMVANIMPADSDELLSTQDYLAGSTVSSLYRLRDIDDSGTAQKGNQLKRIMFQPPTII
jgi:hypothetical protein